MNWTDERVEKLKRLWAEGLSASQIAAQLGGVSRNAVIGKVHRLNLPGRAKAGGSTGANRSAKRPAAPARPANYPARVATRPTARTVGATALKDDVEVALPELSYVPSNDVVVPISRKLALTDLTERTCKWPMGDPLKDDFHFCGVDASEASPYCGYHARLAYQPVADRRKAAARA
ncbi:putative DNA-binding regulatory protein; putative GcrA-like cell cycle regulator [Pseudorhizobium banfieldiae]|uniref:Putative DNA-binding regulatory protein putative GcrA-like cell cycle regulator n=1 Tax=Pseudorhizobium banfieldiae TaxID=1125847 RepID=L0NAN7_9HYPH|nr:GcrA family cell cycle regulator [Pseudorhizobium banfieldiae]CAD6597522.1 GcrA cell cycle regulator [arsenite-oxidising bacterium NT-25]CCF17806.1 putative DNA-binding regulatory protein; putative GcrA-like cell cycle regulator [Pseudorhizobium banfieldiae]